ncbi:MAG: hypothetical protein H7A37_03160 [Chlamydiales bacterium]|nr:hypothetical protein [Chlamydiales bacterium]
MRYCCHARAVENQCYVVLAGNVGNLPKMESMDIQYGLNRPSVKSYLQVAQRLR